MGYPEILEFARGLDRSFFIDNDNKIWADINEPLPIGYGQTISQPSLVVEMSQLLCLDSSKSVLEIGTGSGYATALLSRLGQSVMSLDLDAAQQERAQAALGKAGCTNVQLSVANGLKALANIGSFDVIYVGGGVADVPAELLHTLNEGGRLVVVLGQKRLMHATLISRKGNDYAREMLFETSVPALVDEQQLQKAEFEF